MKEMLSYRPTVLTPLKSRMLCDPLGNLLSPSEGRDPQDGNH